MRFVFSRRLVFFWNSESFQSCLVLHGLFVSLNAFLLLCLFVRGLEVKASPSFGMSFKCIVEVGPVFLKRKAKTVITAPLKRDIIIIHNVENVSVFMQKEITQIVLLDWRVQTNLGRYRWNVSDILHLWHFFAYNQLNFQERNVFFCANKMH